MRNKRARILTMLCAALLLAAGLLYWGDLPAEGSGMAGNRKWRLESGPVLVSLQAQAHRQEIISAWWDEKKESYVLFMPSFWQPERPVKALARDGEIYLDGIAVKKRGSRLRLSEGIHELDTPDGTYRLEVMAGSEIPAMFIDMEPKKRAALYEEGYPEQTELGMALIDCDGQLLAKKKVSGFRVRGNTSADWVKKPYQMTLSGAAGLLGMDAAATWNLLSNWSDKTLMRNLLAYELGRDAGLAFSPDSRFVELYLNGEYQGCYQLCEKVEIGKNRVDIANLEDYTVYAPSEEELRTAQEGGEEGVVTLDNGFAYRAYPSRVAAQDITGGYLLEIERPSRICHSPSFFITARGQPVTIKRPKYASAAEAVYIGALWQSFEDALYAEDGKNPGSGLHYTDYIDQESFVKKYLLEEIVRNYDASSTSQYFYKDIDARDGRICAGPVWDYDMSLGNPIMSPLTNQHYISSVSPYGLFAALPMDDFSLWYRLYERPDFAGRVREVYKETYLPLLKAMEDEKIGALEEALRESALMDGVRWERNKGEDQAERRREYEENVAGLKEFISEREAYLTGLWVDQRESKRVYLDGGDADMYISYVEGLVGERLEEPLAPVREGYTFLGWVNGYTKEPYDFTQPYDGSDLYFAAKYRRDADKAIVIAGEE